MKAPADRPADRPKAQQGAVQRTLRNFAQMLPAMLGTLLLSSLILAWLPHTGLLSWFGRHAVLDVLLGASVGSVAMGHPVAGYLLGGELLDAGVGRPAVTALVVAWVTVGVAHVPAESLALGKGFALRRHALSFVFALAIAGLAELHARSMRTALLAVVLYARAIKLPLLPLLAHYFGMSYMLVLSALIALFALLGGLVMERIALASEHE
ncbi:hypothetical protein ACNKW1_06890 [Thauera sp. WH-2]|uniref:hypothetical protein n=1 Tax=Thauera sp. WH-2 TaxID=3401574 RepID=UPI003AAAFF1B